METFKTDLMNMFISTLKDAVNCLKNKDKHPYSEAV